MGDSRKKIAKQDDLYIKDASRTLRLITTRRSRRKVMSEPPTMPLVPRSGISHLPVSMDIEEKAIPRDGDFSSKGDGVTERVLWHVVKQYARKLGVAQVAPHDLRR